MRPSVSTRTRAARALALAALLAAPAIVAASDAPPPLPPQGREFPDDPYLPGSGQAAAGAGGNVVFGDFTSIQVNVNAAGLNILNDAGNEPSIAVDPTVPNRMVIGWRQFDNVGSNFRQAGWAWSHDGGRTWTFPGVIQPGNFRSDPVLGADADGTIYYCSLSGNFSVQFFRSFNAGLSWGPALPAFGGDKQWFTIDMTGGPGHGNIYESWSVNAGCCGQNAFTRSTDGAASFSTPIQIPSTPIFGTLAVGPDGEVYVVGVSPGNFSNFWVAKSTTVQNGGPPAFDFVSAVDMGGAMELGAGPNPGGLLGQAQVAVDHSEGPTRGNVYLLCSVDPPGDDPLDVHLARSVDGGVTWSDPVRVNNDRGPPFVAWQWFGTMSVAPDGRIDVVWNDTRSTGVSNLSQTFYASSIDGGASFGPNIPMTPVWNSHLGFPNQDKIGDYYDMKSDLVGASLAYATTFNGEQDVWFLRIGDWDCNGNGSPDADDIAGPVSADCNANGIPDECEIAAGTVPDENGDGIPDGCPACPWDLDGSGDVGINDLLDLLADWGNPWAINDLLDLLADWGPC